MFEELGELFGWLLIIAFGCTLLNYFIKFVNKKWGKQLSKSDFGKKVMKLLMTVFVRNHRYFGMLTAVLLIAHFSIQFSRFGINLTGLLAASLMIVQVILGIYARAANKPRKGPWFVAHRSIAVLIILGIGFHLLAPFTLNTVIGASTGDVSTTSQSVEINNYQKRFTKDELSKYNGQNGNPAYVAYKNQVYDVTNNQQWKNGHHNGHSAGTDLTQALALSPHGESVLKELPVVGTYTN